MAGDPHFDHGANRIAVAPGADKLEPQPMVSGALVVAQQQWRAANLRENDVQIAVSIDVGEGRAAANDRFEKIGTALRCRNGLEAEASLVSAIPKQLSRLSILLAGI